MKKVRFFAKNGAITGHIVLTPGANLVAMADAELIEVDFGYFAGASIECDDDDVEEKLENFVLEAYQKWGKFGHYGDVIQVSCYEIEGAEGTKNVFSIDIIGQLAFHKGVLAVDVLPFLIDSEGKIFFVGIILKKGKHAGRPALIGGHVDLKGMYFESAVEAVIHEAEEEAGIMISPLFNDESVSARPIAQALPINVKNGGKVLVGFLRYIDVFRTGIQETAIRAGKKRVDWTIAYSLAVFVDFPLTSELLRSWFKAGEEVLDLDIFEVDCEDILKAEGKKGYFAYDHHAEIFHQAVDDIWRYMRMSSG